MQFSSAGNVWSGKIRCYIYIMDRVHLFKQCRYKGVVETIKQIKRTKEPPSMGHRDTHAIHTEAECITMYMSGDHFD